MTQEGPAEKPATGLSPETEAAAAAGTVDLPRVRAELAKLDEALARYPELRSPEKQARLATWLAEEQAAEEAMERKSEARVMLAFRVTAAEKQGAEDLAGRLSERMAALGLPAGLSLSDVCRMALVQGMKALEETWLRGGVPTTAPTPTQPTTPPAPVRLPATRPPSERGGGKPRSAKRSRR